MRQKLAVIKGNKATASGAALGVFAIGAGIYYYRSAAPAPVPAAPEPLAPVESPAAPPGAPSVEPLPKLEESDGFVRGQAAPLSTDPVFAAWLKADNLLARFAAAAGMIGQGAVPRDALSFMAPRRKFKIRERGGYLFADPRGFARYDAAADAIGSLDAAAAARLFQKYKPLFQEAYQGLGEGKGDVRDALVRAARELLNTPAVGDGAPLKEKGIGYAYVDDALERLSPAQKQLLRMGPKNQAAVQAKLREFSLALGVPDSSIPK